MNLLCSEEFLRFFNTMQVETISLDDALNLMPGALTHIASVLHIGKFEVNISFPPSPQEPNGYNALRILYDDPNGHGYISHSRVIRQAEKGRISFAVFPSTDYEFSDDDKGSLDFLIKCIHLIVVRSELSEQLQKRQFTDYMTQLPNNAYFMKFSNDLSLRGTINKYTVIFSNLRNFNYINQQMGSQVGDIVLREYSHKLKKFYGSDELIARFGGDNFVALLKNENVNRYLDYISVISITVASGNQTKTLTVNARSGIYPIPTNGSNIGEAINRANASLAYSKRVSDNDRVWFRDEILERINKDREVVSSFRPALIHKEFLVYYQPKVSLDSRHISGCEALVRWKHDGNMIPPGMFVPILEEEGFICDLDFYVLERVCEDIRNWIGKGITPARVSVNFSKLHLRNENLINDVMDIISKYRINPGYIEIELTESSSATDFAALTDFVNKLKEHGIRTSIDDFGTGYSSLSLIKDLNVDIIKIDKSFVDHIADTQSKDYIILNSILSMVMGLGMDVIAEGCETLEQAKVLYDMNCRMIQGYLFDKPLSHDEYTQKLSDNHIYEIEL